MTLLSVPKSMPTTDMVIRDGGVSLAVVEGRMRGWGCSRGWKERLGGRQQEFQVCAVLCRLAGSCEEDSSRFESRSKMS